MKLEFSYLAFISICILALVTPTRAAADGFTGMDLYRFCKDHGAQSADSTICLAYLKGMTGGLLIGQAMAELDQQSCLENIEIEQARLIVEKYMKDHPEKLNESAQVLTFQALIAAFPCKK